MAKRQHSSERIPGLPVLAPNAEARVRTAELNAIDALVECTRKAAKQFLEATDVHAKAALGKPAQRAIALRRTQRAFRDAMIQAGRTLFDAVAAEYLAIDAIEAYSIRLRQAVLPFVLRNLPMRLDDDMVEAAIMSKLPEWESRRTMASPPPTALTRQSPIEVIEKFRRMRGWTIEEMAAQANVHIKQIYKVKDGNPVTTITIAKIAGALGCPPGDLLLMASPPQKPRLMGKTPNYYP